MPERDFTRISVSRYRQSQADGVPPARPARTLAISRILNDFVLSRRLTRSSAISDRRHVYDNNPQQTGILRRHC
jgi:hypothetical protein